MIAVLLYVYHVSVFSLIFKRLLFFFARKGIALFFSFFGGAVFFSFLLEFFLSTPSSVLPDLNLPLPPAEVPPLPPVEVPPLTPEEILDVDAKIRVRRRIERWLQLIYNSDGRPEVEDANDFRRMVNFIFMDFEDESLQEHEAVLFDLERWGSGSRYYEKLMNDWFGERNQRRFPRNQ